jgi:hypothetical protein
MASKSTKKRFAIILAACVIVLTLLLITLKIFAKQRPYQFLSKHEPACSHSDKTRNGDAIVETVYSFETDYDAFCTSAQAELLSTGYKNITKPVSEGHRDYIKMTTEQINVSFVKGEVFHSEATAGSTNPIVFAHKDGWMTVKIHRLQPKNKLRFLWQVWSSKLL